MTTTPVPPHLSDEERALWEKAEKARAAEARRRARLATNGYGYCMCEEEPCPCALANAALAELQLAMTPAVVSALLTEREAGKRDRKRLDWLSARMESCDDGLIAWNIVGLNPSTPSLRDAIDNAAIEEPHA